VQQEKLEKYHLFGLLTSIFRKNVLAFGRTATSGGGEIPFQSSRLFQDRCFWPSLAPCWSAVNSAAAQTALL